MLKNVFIILFVITISFVGYKVLFEKKEPTSLDLLIFGMDSKYFSESMKKYEKNNNIKINVSEANYFNFISVLEEKHKKNEKIPDIFLIVNDQIPSLADNDMIADIDDKDLNVLLPLSKESVKYNGKYYGYPFYMETLFFFYNKKFVPILPDKITDILTLSKKLESDNKITGMVFPTDEYYFHFPWFSYVGGTEQDLLSMKDKNIDTLKKELKLTKDNFKYANFNLALTLFKEENAAILINGNWILNYLKDSNLNYGIKTIKNDNFKTFAGVKVFVVYKYSEKKNEAVKLLKYIDSFEIQNQFASQNGFIPVNKEVFEKRDNPILKEFKNNQQNYVLMPNSPKLKDFWLKSNEVLNRIFKDKEDIDKVVDEVFEEKK